MINIYTRFLKFNYSPKILIGTLCANTAISIYSDKKIGYTTSTIFDVCSDTSHVFNSTSHSYDINKVNLVFNIPFSIILGTISIPINFYINIIKERNYNYYDYFSSNCLCGKIK